MLRQEQAYNRDAILQLQLLTLDVVLAKLHLQQIVLHSHTGTHGHVDILMDFLQQGLDSLDGLHLLLQGYQLPVVLLGLLQHIVLGELQLESADVLAYPGEFVTIDDLSTGKDRLDSRQTANGSVLHH